MQDLFTQNTFSIGNKPVPNILVSCDHGLMIVNRFDDTEFSISQMLLEHGNNNTVEADLTMRLLENTMDPIVFDVGANIGTYATWIAKYLEKKNGKIYCFEPQRVIFQMLCGNMAINNIFNAYTYNIALGSEEKYLEVDEIDYVRSGSFAAFNLDGVDREKFKTTSQKQHVEVCTIDQFVNRYKVPKVDFIKIDVEGMDMEVLNGAKQVIDKFKPDLHVEFIHLGSSKKDDTAIEGRDILSEYLTQLGYNTYQISYNMLATTKNLNI